MRLSIRNVLALCGLLLCLGFLATRPAAAQGTPSLVFSLNPATGLPGAFIPLTGDIVNPADPNAIPPPDDIVLNDISFGPVSGPSTSVLTFDTNTFFLNVPGIFSAGDTYTGPIFGIHIASGAPNGLYSGSVNLLGGTDQSATNTLGTATFFLQIGPVSPAPEPATLPLLGMGLPGLAALCLRRRSAISG